MSSYQKYLSAGLVATGALLAGPSPAWAQDFTVLAGTAVTCTAGSITGDVGIANGTAASPFTNTGCAFAGTAHVNDPAAKSAYAGFLSSYSALAPKTTDVCPVITGTLAGTILTPGTYCVSSEAKTGVLTLDGTSNPYGTWTIKVPSGALTGTNFSVVMAGGAQACNVTWWVDAAATMTTSNLKGNLLTGADITVTGGTFVKGDAFAGGDGSTVTPSGEVTLTGATVVGCEGGSPGPGPGPDPHKCSDRVTGGGYITVNGKHANFGVTGGIRNGKPRGHLTYIDHGTGLKVKGTGVLYISANFNKRQIVLDLKDEADKAKAYRLASHCDVFIQNMRTGAAEKLGFGYDDIVAVRPDVIYVTSTAYGRVGPMASDGGVDPLLQAFSGFTSVNGPEGSDGEMFRHLAHLDITTSSNIVEAVHTFGPPVADD